MSYTNPLDIFQSRKNTCVVLQWKESSKMRPTYNKNAEIKGRYKLNVTNLEGRSLTLSLDELINKFLHRRRTVDFVSHHAYSHCAYN